MRDEHLIDQIFESLLESQVFAEDRQIDHDYSGTHSAHGWPADNSHSSHSELTHYRGSGHWGLRFKQPAANLEESTPDGDDDIGH